MLKYNRDGLIPVVVQDYESKEVLMLAYANEEAIKKTLESGYAHYFSRSRKKLWMKGEESGNFQKIVEIRKDCDGDAILYLVKQRGFACHTGNFSCFFSKINKIDEIDKKVKNNEKSVSGENGKSCGSDESYESDGNEKNDRNNKITK